MWVQHLREKEPSQSEIHRQCLREPWQKPHANPCPTPCPAAICALQNAAIIGLIFRLGTVARSTQLAVTAALAAAGWWLFGGTCPPALLTALQTGSVALLALGGRLPQVRGGRRARHAWGCRRTHLHLPRLRHAITACYRSLRMQCLLLLPAPHCPSSPTAHTPTRPQILLNMRRGNSGELSLGTCALSFVGNLARVYTTATLVKDPLILGSAAVQARRVMLRGLLQASACEAYLPVGCGSPCQHAGPAGAVLACPTYLLETSPPCRRCSTASSSGSACRRRASCAPAAEPCRRHEDRPCVCQSFSNAGIHVHFVSNEPGEVHQTDEAAHERGEHTVCNALVRPLLPAAG